MKEVDNLKVKVDLLKVKVDLLLKVKKVMEVVVTIVVKPVILEENLVMFVKLAYKKVINVLRNSVLGVKKPAQVVLCVTWLLVNQYVN